jgi:hypothetical protein
MIGYVNRFGFLPIGKSQQPFDCAVNRLQALCDNRPVGNKMLGKQLPHIFAKIGHFVKASQPVAPYPPPDLPRPKFWQAKRHNPTFQFGQ